MSDLCMKCRHRRAPDKVVLEQLSMPAASASAHAELNRQKGELLAELRVEDLVFERQGGGALSRRPIQHDWCAQQSSTKDDTYYFCDWLVASECAYYKCATIAKCQRCDTGKGVCVNASPAAVVTASVPVAVSAPSAAPRAARPADRAEWCLPLGKAYELNAKRVLDDSFGSGSFQVDFELSESSEQPAIRGKGLAQTYLMFGGPGAGKTHYFKYLLSSLLAHPSRPGCLLLDPKGVLTPWMELELQKLNRLGDLTVLAASGTKSAFNLLGIKLKPNELGRLLSEVVLAGASGIDEGWQVLISDLLEAASIVISKLDGSLTARTLLHAILYRQRFRVGDGPVFMEYPIVVQALHAGKVARKKPRDVDLAIASDRIADYFKSTEDRQRRFVRQIIERSLGELMLPEWEFLSNSDAENSVYSEIIHNGRVVTVAVGQSSPAFQRAMSTLAKSLFQQAVLSDLAGRAPNQPTPFFILACDEYAQAITEGETGLVSDSRFFSLSRDAGCMSLLALQSVATGRSRFPATMHDRWEAILGNVTVKFFMRVNDVETAEMGSALAGSQHSFIPVMSQQLSAQGLSATDSVTMLEHPRVPPWFLTNRMAQGDALLHGTLDGKSAPTSLFVHAPATW